MADDKLNELVEAGIIAKLKDKSVASTQTWCVYFLIKLFFHIKGSSLLPDGLPNVIQYLSLSNKAL